MFPLLNRKFSMRWTIKNTKKKLGEIVTEDRKKKTLDPEVEKRKKLNLIRVQNFKFQSFERSQAIDKDNQLLLGRLVEISKQKKPKLTTTKSEAVIPKTLNAPYRKRELERIANENEALARRLLTQNSAFSMKRLEDDFDRHRVLLKAVQKLTPSPKGKGKLPPLSGPETAKASVSKKIKLPERVNQRSSSSDVPATTTVDTLDKKKEEISPIEKKPEIEKKEDPPATNLVQEEIADETNSPTQTDNQKVIPSVQKIENGSKTNLEKKENPPPNNTTDTTNTNSPLKKTTTLKSPNPEKKDETTNNNPGDKKPDNVNTENKPKDINGSQSNIPDKKGGNSGNPSKTEIK